ncbi:hypothetical protein EZV62_025423 [Acer yangbiense]|uniref:Amino acid transporter transmembrane domain-containing protein n=1 Tax=Acer yangbiense TaxID=1000413 RepID=A0A5C7GXT0_9ROSI|nr:hypothetical protein EZV62_025423 [Acer yangbiense]
MVYCHVVSSELAGRGWVYIIMIIHLQWKPLNITRKGYATKAKKGLIQLEEEDEPMPIIKVDEKKGSIAGAVALVIGTSIGSGILALPQKASPAGILPSSISLITCWGFLLIEALLLIEINLNLRRKKMKKREEEGDELDVISIRTMAQETLGDFGGTLATIFYVFLGYTSMIVYSSKSGEILFHLINIPESVSGFLFTGIFTILISIGGTRTTDQVNQWLTASMISLLLAIEVLAVTFGGWSGFDGIGNWGKVPDTIPVIIFSLVYHDLAPVLCAYLDGDLTRLRVSVLIGSIVPLLALLVWDAIALGLSAQADQVVDPVELLKRHHITTLLEQDLFYRLSVINGFTDLRICGAAEDRSQPVLCVEWSGVPLMVETFSLLAIGTSLIGTLLSFSEFFKEQLNNLSWQSSSSSKESSSLEQQPGDLFGIKNWWGRNKISFTATAMVVAPTLFVSTTVPDAFSAATDIAGGYCMTMLYGVLPPAMAWAVYKRESDDGDRDRDRDRDSDRFALSGARPVVFVVGLFACCIVVEQILQDFSSLQLHT